MMTSGPTIRRAWRSARFTLLELLVAMSILVMLMTLLLNIIQRAQSIWVLERKKTEIYENARVLFELVSRDLQGLVASEKPEVRYMLNLGYDVLDATPPKFESQYDVRAAFVTSSGIGYAPVFPGKDQSDLVEVVYLLEKEGLQRHVTSDRDLVLDTWDVRYDFYGASTMDWVKTKTIDRYDTILEGVESFDIWFFRDGATVNEVDTIITDSMAVTPDLPDSFEMPVRARIQVVLIDSNTRAANRHIFTKNIFFGRGL